MKGIKPLEQFNENGLNLLSLIISFQKTDTYHQGEAKAKAAEKFKAIMLLIVGIIMLGGLAEPLVESVRQFSDSVNIEPFYVSFILVPLATNARTAIAAIRAASQKRHHTTSLTFSEVCPHLDYDFIIYKSQGSLL